VWHRQKVDWEVTANGYRVSFGGDKNVLKLIAKPCEYIKNC
jgi:hypothetical protein